MHPKRSREGAAGDGAAPKKRRRQYTACICGCNKIAAQPRGREEYEAWPAEKHKGPPTEDDQAMVARFVKRFLTDGKTATKPTKPVEKNIDRIAKGESGARIRVHRDHFAESYWRAARQGSARKVDRERVIAQCLRGRNRDTDVLVARAQVIAGIESKVGVQSNRLAARGGGVILDETDAQKIARLERENARLQAHADGHYIPKVGCGICVPPGFGGRVWGG